MLNNPNVINRTRKGNIIWPFISWLLLVMWLKYLVGVELLFQLQKTCTIPNSVLWWWLFSPASGDSFVQSGYNFACYVWSSGYLIRKKSCSWSTQHQKNNIICLPSAPQIPLNLNMRKNCCSPHPLPRCKWFTTSDHHRPTLQTDKCKHGGMSANQGDCPKQCKNCPCKPVARAMDLFVYLYGCLAGISVCQVGDLGHTPTCLLPDQPGSS